jgi:integrase/recombinase XerD
MEDQLSSFLDFLSRERNYSENTTDAYRNDLGQFLRWLHKQYPNIVSWQTVTDHMVVEYVKSLQERSYTASSVARKVAAIKSFFHFMLARGQIFKDPTIDLESPKVKKRLPRTLPADEVARLLEAPARKRTPKGLRDSALLHLLYTTGMRVSEAVSLQVDDVSLEDSILHCPGKDNSVRDLPLEPNTKVVLANYLENGRPHLIKNKDETALFLNHRGSQLTRQGLWLIIKAYASEADLSERVTPHTLRHSFAAHKLNSGVELREIQLLLGHANISTTQIYSQLSKSTEE